MHRAAFHRLNDCCARPFCRSLRLLTSRCIWVAVRIDGGADLRRMLPSTPQRSRMDIIADSTTSTARRRGRAKGIHCCRTSYGLAVAAPERIRSPAVRNAQFGTSEKDRNANATTPRTGQHFGGNLRPRGEPVPLWSAATLSDVARPSLNRRRSQEDRGGVARPRPFCSGGGFENNSPRVRSPIFAVRHEAG